MTPASHPGRRAPQGFGQRLRAWGLDWTSLGVVTIVAALIWLFAEAASLARIEQQIRIQIVDPTASHVIHVRTEQWPGAVRASLQGPAGGVQKAAANLADGVALNLGQPGLPSTDGEQVVDLRAALQAAQAIHAAGLTVVAVDPPTLRIEVEAIVDLPEVDVQVRLDGVTAVEAPVANPVRVRVSGPQRVIDALRSLRDGPRVEARISSASADPAPQTAEARLTLPGSLAAEKEVRIVPPTAQVTFRVASRLNSHTIPSVPVWLARPPTMDAESARIEVHPEDQLLRDIVLTGPTEAIEPFRQGRLSVIALVAISSDDVANRTPSKPVSAWLAIDPETAATRPLPDGVRVDGAERLVRLVTEQAEVGPTLP